MAFHPTRLSRVTLVLLGCGMLAGCIGGKGRYNAAPEWLGPITTTEHRGGDDLLTAGLGKTGLASASAPAIADPAAPTPAELRRLVIHTNYRALVDMTSNGGFGRIYGPNIDLAGNDVLGEGMIPGTEYLAFAKNVSGVRNVTLLVQLPDSFDPAKPCIVAAPSSGSRGVYGAIATTGEWALKRGCAVAYTDKGTGAGGHELDTDTVTLIDGTLATSETAGKDAYFSAGLSTAERAAYVADHPHRYAMKHAHSGDNPERIWGRSTLYAIDYAFYVLNEKFGHKARNGKTERTITPENTTVIAASVSNGGGAVLAAAEEDVWGVIDGVVAVEPQINLKPNRRVSVERGGNPVSHPGRPLYDYITYANLVQPCAAIAPSNADSPFVSFVVPAFAQNRCAALASAGMISGATVAEQSEDAKSRLQTFGWEPESALLHASHYGFAVSPAVSVTYANAFEQADVRDNLCGYSMATTDAVTGAPAAPAASPMPTLWALNNGVPPSTGINLVAEDAANGPIREPLAVSASTGQADYYFDGAHCLRELLNDRKVQANIAEASVRGNLHGKPTLIVHGRSDALVPVNHTSRPYLGANSLAEGRASELSYIEVTNGQHFEAFLPFAGFDSRFIPLHVYGGRALDLMWDHLHGGKALPPSQLVRTTPRGGLPGAAPALTLANLPPISATPAAGDRITVKRGAVSIPD